jgi:general secretion pathway protein D
MDEEDYVTRRKSEPQVVIPAELKQDVSLSLSENVPIKSVLYETAKKLNISFQMDPSINSRVIFQARRRPFIEVLDAVCDMTNLRYTISGCLVRVENDTPYSHSYSAQFLNISRDSENKVSITTEISSTPGGTTDSKGTTQQDSNVSIKAKSDFWQELEDGLKVIIGADSKNQTRYAVNRQSGVITVCANSKIHRHVREYIEQIKCSTMSQVLIEAKIIEVTLKNEYRRGIDWALLGGRFNLSGKLLQNSGDGINNIGAHGDPLKLSFSTNKGDITNMNSIVGALEEFGSTRTISNPRITAMNNQAAVLKVAQNHVYFKLNYEKNYVNDNNNRQEVAVSSDIKTVPLGLVMFVQPSIDVAMGTITLFLRPTITKLASSVNDPAVNIAMKSSAAGDIAEADRSKIPVTEVREVVSVLKLNDGEVAVLGGFMEIRSSKSKSGIPGYSDIPIAGELVSSHGMGDQIVELVVLIKVRIANYPLHQRAADIKLQRFVPDPRPFNA